MNYKTTISIRIPIELLQKIDNKTNKTTRNRSQTIEEALTKIKWD